MLNGSSNCASGPEFVESRAISVSRTFRAFGYRCEPGKGMGSKWSGSGFRPAVLLQSR
jgi:hypothetical protein